MDHDAGRVDPKADPGSLKRRSVRGAAATLVSQSFRFLVSIVSLIVLARLLSPVDYGLVAMAAPLIGFVQMFSDFGLSHAVVQRQTISQRELSALFWLTAVVSLGLTLLLLLIHPLIAWFYAEPRVAPIVAALSPLLFLSGLAAQHMALLTRQMRFGAVAVLDVVVAATGVAVGVSAAAMGFGYWSLVAMQVWNSCIKLALAWTLSGWRPSRPCWDPGVLPMLRFGGDITGHHVIRYFAYNLDKVLLGATHGTAAVGLYDRGTRLIAMPTWELMEPVARVAVPLLSRLTNAPETYRRGYERMVGPMLLAIVPGAVMATVVPGRVIETLIGAQWLEAAPILAWVSAAAMLAPLNTSASWLFVSQARTRQQLIWGPICSVALILSFAAGLPWGPVGVAAASAVCFYTVYNPLLLWAATREGPVRPRDVIRIILPFVLAGGAAALVLGLADGWLPPAPNLFGLGLALPLSYAATGLALACLPEGRRILRDAWDLRSALRSRGTAPSGAAGGGPAPAPGSGLPRGAARTAASTGPGR